MQPGALWLRHRPLHGTLLENIRLDINRREALVISAMMFSALAELDGSPPADSVVDVVIVGAGVSGLAAAGQLNQAGCTTVVLEAQPQIGGRLQRLQVGLSNRSTSGAVPGWVDLGGQWAGHTQTKTLKYARKLNISTFPVPVGGKDTFYYEGRLSRHNHAWPSTPYNLADHAKDWPAFKRRA
jgi:monoamine oxidase